MDEKSESAGETISDLGGGKKKVPGQGKEQTLKERFKGIEDALGLTIGEGDDDDDDDVDDEDIDELNKISNGTFNLHVGTKRTGPSQTEDEQKQKKRHKKWVICVFK